MMNILFLGIPLRRGILYVGEGEQFLCCFGQVTEAAPQVEDGKWLFSVMCLLSMDTGSSNKTTELTKCLGGIDISPKFSE